MSAATPFLVGFGEADITPSAPSRMAGYYYPRLSTGVHDRLAARAMAVSDGKGRVVLCVADLIHLTREVVTETRRLVRERCGIRDDHVLLSCIHTHTGPSVREEKEYAAGLPAKFADAVTKALDTLQPAELRAGRGEERTVAFCRRYRMKDGSVRTNPGILNPDVKEPLGTPDYAVSVLLAADAAPRGGVVHFGLHCDTVGGTELSADWTHYVRETLRKKLGGDMPVLTPIGTAGDVNHWNVFKPVTARGFAETERIGNAIGTAAVEALKNAAPVPPGPVRAARRTVEVDIRFPSDEELAEARRILAQPPPEGVDFTMERVHAARAVRAAKTGPTARLDVTVLAFGNVALVGMPCELFTDLGRDIKERSPFEHTLVITLADANVGYVGPRKAHEEGGYEMASSLLAPGMGEKLADTAVALLDRVFLSKRERTRRC